MIYKKSQVQSQLFTYVMSVIIAGMILLLGYKAVDKFSEDASFAEELQFENNLKKLFNRIDYKSELVEEIILPESYNGICFVRMQDAAGGGFPSGLNVVNVGSQAEPLTDHNCQMGSLPIVQSYCNSSSRSNVFLIDNNMKIATAALDVGSTKIKYTPGDTNTNGHNKDFICFKTKTQKIALKLYGCGKSGILVSGPGEEILKNDCKNL